MHEYSRWRHHVSEMTSKKQLSFRYQPQSGILTIPLFRVVSMTSLGVVCLMLFKVVSLASCHNTKTHKCSIAVFSIFVYQLFTIFCLLFMWPMICKNIFRRFIFVVTKKFRSRWRINQICFSTKMTWFDLIWPLLTPMPPPRIFSRGTSYDFY